MASTKNYLDPRILADLNGLVLRTRHIVDGWLAGTHHNLDPGTSTEYSQHRPYVPGDDLRHIDWKAYGRTDRIYVKQFLDETNLACTFVLDASASMQYRGPGSPLSKLEYAGCLVGSLAWLLNEQGDGTGLFVCGGSGSGTSHGSRRISYPHLPPAATQFQLTQLIQQIEATKPSGDSDIGNGLREWGMRTQRRQLLVVVSDFFGDAESLESSLTDLRQFGHEVILFQTCDRDEAEFPFDQFTEFKGMESAEQITLDANVFRQGYLEKFTAAQQRLQEFCQRSAIDFSSLVTDESLGSSLGHFLTVRGLPESGI